MLSLRKLKLLKRRHHLSGLDEILPPLLLLLLIRYHLRQHWYAPHVLNLILGLRIRLYLLNSLLNSGVRLLDCMNTLPLRCCGAQS